MDWTWTRPRLASTGLTNLLPQKLPAGDASNLSATITRTARKTLAAPGADISLGTHTPLEATAFAASAASTLCFLQGKELDSS